MSDPPGVVGCADSNGGGLWELVAETVVNGRKLGSVAIVGMAKNTGKTVVLNCLVRRATAAGRTVGVLSVGRDGEAVDVFTSRPKPRIWAPPGTLVATVPVGLSAAPEVALLDPGSVRWTGIVTILGEIAVGRVLRAGKVELIGPTGQARVRRLVELLRDAGASLVLIDGALDRMASAAPPTAEGVILATGAVLGRSASEVARKTAFRVKLFLLPRAPEGFDRDNAATAIVGEALTEADVARAAEAGRGAEFLAASGAVTDRLLIALGRLRFGGTLVVRDATRLLVSQEGVAFFESRGGRLAVEEPLRLMAVTVNSHNPTGPGLAADELLRAVGEAVRPVPVFDVVYGRKA